MKLCVSGSMDLIDEMEALASTLRGHGHTVSTPSRADDPAIASRLPGRASRDVKAIFVEDHLKKIKRCDALLIANLPKNGVDGYVGQSALLEAAMAYALGKRIYVLRPPATPSAATELEALNAVILHDDVSRFCK